MLTDPFKIAFFTGWVVYAFGIYSQSIRHFRRQRIAQEQSRPVDIFLDMTTLFAWQILPLIYVFSPWLDFANYQIPLWAGWTGVAMLAAAILLLRSAYNALGFSWSPKIDIREGQELVTEGIFRYIRHPIYAGMWLWALSQPLVVQNWIAGWAMGIIFLPLYLIRVPREEAMLLRQYGDRYRDYMSTTGRIIPPIKRKGP
jgi:protein-S-isoprenylcysteine O-methyltransferase Ste14